MATTNGGHDEPLILACMRCRHSELCEIIHGSSRLPLEVSGFIAQFLVVPRVVHDEVQVFGASSMDPTQQLSDCLVNDEESWWLSGFGSMPNGRGEEFVEFQLTRRGLLRRVRAVSMRIPPLPLGPLSVREFRVDVCSESGTWQKLPTCHQVDNRTGMQRFEIGEIDAAWIRIVCLSNQMSSFLTSMESPHRLERVGFYAVQFD